MSKHALRVIFVLMIALMTLAGALALLDIGRGGPTPVQAQGLDGYAIYYVAPDCSGLIVVPCYTSIQAAVDAVDAADEEIRVAVGTYATVNSYGGLQQIAYISKSLTLRGGYNADFSVWDPASYVSRLDSDDGGRGLTITGTVAVTVEGCTITDNSADGLGGSQFDFDAGGGIYVVEATATISDNIISQNVARQGDNDAGYGGGIHLLNSDSRVLNNVIQQNDATTGGGMFGSTGAGGGLCAEGGAPWVEGNTIVANQAGTGSGWFGFGEGGGLAFIESRPTVWANDIRENRAVGDDSNGAGGGIELLGCPAFTLTNNIVAENTGGSYGANGIDLTDMSGQPSSGWLLHNTLASNRNSGGAPGLYVDAGVVGTRAVVTAVNTIIVDHDVGVAVGGSLNATVTVQLTRTLWGEGAWANDVNVALQGDDPPTHTITSALPLTGTPGFQSSSGGDYHIGTGSDAVDAGVSAGVATDIDGAARDASPDIGADEVSQAGLQMNKAVGAETVYPGETLAYTVVVTSNGTLDLTGVIVTDTLPAQVRPLAGGATHGSCAIVEGGYGGVLHCDVGNLAVGQYAVITLTGQVTSTEPVNPPVTLRNSAQAESDQAANTASVDVTWRATPDCHVRVNGGGPTYDTVQTAVNAAADGDVLWIAGLCQGTQGYTQQAVITKTLTLRGGYPPDFGTWNPDMYITTLDAERQGRVLLITDTGHVTVSHLTLTGGDATGQSPPDGFYYGAGGGAYVAPGATATFVRSLITDNVASTQGDGLGGGVAVYSGTLHLEESTLAHNVALSGTFMSGYGGGWGAISATVQVEECVLAENTASSGPMGTGGGAFVHDSQAAIRQSVWFTNTASVVFGSGGALAIWEGPVDVSGNVLRGNVAGYGSAIWVYDAPVTLVNDAVLHNWAATDGSAVWVEGPAPVTLLHPTLARNVGRAAVGAELSATVVITNAIVYSQTVGLEATDGSTVTVAGVLWYGNLTNTVATTATIQVSHPVTGAPALDSDGYHLTAASPARDVGVVSGVAMDIDGEARPRNDDYDLGADEYWINRPPVADAGSGQMVAPGAQVTLDGSGSDDPDGDALAYGWRQMGGLDVSLSSVDVVSPTFTAPSTAGVLTFSLTVTDTGALADTDTVTVTVVVANRPPVADAGSGQTVALGAQVTLGGSGSDDPDGDVLAYGWRQMGGLDVSLSSVDVVSPTFTAPSTAGVLTFSLTVTDTGALADTDTVTVTVIDYRVYLPLLTRQSS